MDQMHQREVRMDSDILNPDIIKILFCLCEIDVNKTNEYGGTILHEAVKLNNIKIASILIKIGSDINKKDSEGNTPLSLAIDIKLPAMIELLLKQNPDLNVNIVRAKFFTCLLDLSMESQNIIQLMLKYGFALKDTDNLDVGMLWNSILFAFEKLAISIVTLDRSFLTYIEIWFKAFLLHPQPLNAIPTIVFETIANIRGAFLTRKTLPSIENRNLCLMQIFLSSEHCEELLKVHGICVNKDSDDFESSETSLIISVIKCCYDSNNPVCDGMGRTALHYAAKVGSHGSILALMVDLNLDMNAKDKNGKTPLDYIHDQINELSDCNYGNNNIIDKEFNHSFSLYDLNISAVSFINRISKFVAANLYTTEENLKTLKLLMAVIDKSQRFAGFTSVIFDSYLQQCREEIEIMKSKKLLSELSYFDFLIKSSNKLMVYTKRTEVIEALLLSDSILHKYKIYGKMLRHKFLTCNTRRCLFEVAECTLFEIMKSMQLSIVVVREILSYFSNEELFTLIH